MARDEWYRRQNWTENDRREFFEHLARSRSKSHKAQYVRIQAFHLAEVGEIHGAIGLLQHLFAELPESSELAAAHAQMAECLIALGRTDDALNEYRAALLAEKNLPNVRTRAWLQFPWVVATTGMRHLYTEARSFLEWGERQATFSHRRIQAGDCRGIYGC